MITIVGLGYEISDITLGASEILRSGAPVILRTVRHPVAKWLENLGIMVESLDVFYEEKHDFDQMIAACCRELLQKARQGDIIYAVPGGAGLMDETVRALCAAAASEGIELRLVPGVGLAEKIALDAGGFSGGQVFSAQALCKIAERVDIGQPLLVTEIDGVILASEVKLALLENYPPEHTVLWRDQSGQTRWIALCDMDRVGGTGHCAGLYLPAVALTQCDTFGVQQLVEIMRELRAPTGCPWDREQTHGSLTRYLVEEAYEVIDAVDSGEPLSLADELGDVLLQVVFHAQIAFEHAEFTLRDITTAVCRKMIHRHPHIFAANADKLSSAAEVLDAWEVIKRKEKQLDTAANAMLEVPRALPALMRAEKVQKKAKPIAEKRDGAVETDPALGQTVGDALFDLVRRAIQRDIAPEQALMDAVDRFIQRFTSAERRQREKGEPLEALSAGERAAIWRTDAHIDPLLAFATSGVHTCDTTVQT